MSMAINRISASSVAAMLYPVTKPSRVAKVDTGRATTAAADTTTAAVQPASASSSTSEDARAAFEYAKAALQGSTGAMAATMAQSSADQGQYDGHQQVGGVAYAQAEQEVGQSLDLTA